MSLFLRNLATGAVWAALGLAATIPFLVWGSERAPEFFGAFTAAIVAAIAVVLGAYYQAELTRRRDDEIARRKQIAKATDLFLWLGHAIREMSFIANFLHSVRERQKAGFGFDISIDRYREIVSAPFMEELRERARESGRLSPMLGAIVAPVLYDTFQIVDRIYHFRGALPADKFDPDGVEQHHAVTLRRVEKLRQARTAVGDFLAAKGVPAIVVEE
jgi:hypothetical protein